MLVADIEANALEIDEVTKIHCVNIYDTVSKKQYRFNDKFFTANGTVEEGLRMLMEAEVYGGHNFIGYDELVIKKLYPFYEPKGQLRDSLVECRVVWPNIKDLDFQALRKKKLDKHFVELGLVGSHKLAAWGYRLGNYKQEIETDWQWFTPEMDDYCMQDVMVNADLFALIDSKGINPECLELENKVAAIIRRQETHGVLYDLNKHYELLRELETQRAEIHDSCSTVFKPWYKPDGKYIELDEFGLKGRGLKVAKVGKPDGKGVYVKGAPYTKVKLTSFNPNSRQHIGDRLQALFGWVPLEFTDTGQPKIDDEILRRLPYPRVNELADYLAIQKVIGMMSEGNKAWIKFVNPKTGRIHGRVNSNGALTGRMTHNSPNLAQTPSSRTEVGKKCRELFTVPKGKKLVGCDASGLELRGLANRMYKFDKGAYAEVVLKGDKKKGTDEHSLNRKALKLNERDNAKTWFYAYIYGASAPLLGQTVVEDFEDEKRKAFEARFKTPKQKEQAYRTIGKKAVANIEGSLPALAKLQKELKRIGKRDGALVGLDGRPLPVRHFHAILNLQLQSDGAVVMKKALVLLDESLQKDYGLVAGEHYEFVLNVHDEFQIEVDEEYADLVGKRAADAIREAGEYYKFECELAGEYDIGDSWRETH